jgi:ABC-type amino acid transport substrate-binding protein
MIDNKTNKLIGYSIDLLDKISLICNFTYRINVIKEGGYGKITKENTWSGVVKELIENKADLSTPMTINVQRAQAIDFSKPIMSLGIGILFKRSLVKKINYLSFLAPLRFDTWTCLLCAYLGFNLFRTDNFYLSVESVQIIIKIFKNKKI